MKNKILIGSVVVVLVILGSIFMFRGKESGESIVTPSASTEAQATNSNAPFEFATLQEAYKSGKSLKCTVNTSSQKFTFYFKDGNMRYETSLTSGATKIETGQIIKKDVAYAWTNMSSDIVTTTDPKAIEFSRNAAFQLDTLLSNPRSNVKLSCVQTSVSNSLFDKPKN